MMKSKSSKPVQHDLLAAFLAILLTLPAALARADETAPEDAPSTFGDVVDVELVNIEVWVTGQDGQPISGLSADDFQVFEDGQPVDVSHFTALRGPTTAGQVAPLAPLPAAPEPAAAEAQDPGYLVVYFDETNLSIVSRKRAAKELREFIEQQALPPERVMILRQAADLRIAASFQSSADELDAALRSITKEKSHQPISHRIETLQELERMWESVAEMRNGPCVFFEPRAQAEIANYAARSRLRFAETMNHLGATSTFLAALPGVKTLLFVSDTMEFSPGDDLLDYINFRCPLQDQDHPLVTLGEELSEEMLQLTRHANANRVTLYSWRAHGIRSNALGVATDVPRIPLMEAKMRASSRGGLAFLANDTGGRFLSNSQIQDELGRVVDSMTTYYSLAYPPPHGGDGKEHAIEVRLPGVKKAQVRYRHGYKSKGADERMREALRGALVFGLVSNPLMVRLGAGELKPTDTGNVIVPLHIQLPSDDIVFVPGADGEQARLKVEVASRGENGKIFFHEKTFTAEPPSAGKPLALTLDVELPEGMHMIGVAVRDDVSRETSYVATALKIVKPEEEIAAIGL